MKCLLTKPSHPAVNLIGYLSQGTHPPLLTSYKKVMKMDMPKYYYQSSKNLVGTRFEGFVKRIGNWWEKTNEIYNPTHDVWVFLASGQPHMGVGSQFNHWVTNGEEIIEVLGCYYMPMPDGKQEFTWDRLRRKDDAERVPDYRREEIQKVLEMILDDNKSDSV